MRRSNCALMSTMKEGFTSAYSAGIDNLVGPVRLGVFVQLLQPGQEAGFVAHFAGAVVVRVARLPVRQDHHARLQLADLHRQRHARG